MRQRRRAFFEPNQRVEEIPAELNSTFECKAPGSRHPARPPNKDMHISLYVPCGAGGPLLYRPRFRLQRTPMADHHDYIVKDITLAEWGRKELAIAEVEMPGLMATRAEFAKSH